MTEHLVDTEIKLGNCNRCQGWVYLAMSSGLRSAADIVPVSRQQYIQALVDGRRLFRLHTKAGKPWKLGTTRLRDLNPSFDAAGNQGGGLQLLAEHGCGGAARNMLTFREVEQGPRSAPVMPGEHRGGIPQPVAPAWPASPSSPARHATVHPSDGTKRGTKNRHIEDLRLPEPAGGTERREAPPVASGAPQRSGKGQISPRPHCGRCSRVIAPGAVFWGFQHGERWEYAEHVECPDE